MWQTKWRVQLGGNRLQQEYRLLVNNMPDGIIRLDMNGRFVFINRTVA
jgi:PAS domain-containing protein